MVNTELQAPVVGQAARVTERLLLQRPSLKADARRAGCRGPFQKDPPPAPLPPWGFLCALTPSW